MIGGLCYQSLNRAREYIFLAGGHAQRVQAQSLARAGVNLARAGLVLDQNGRDDLEEDWAQLSILSQMMPLQVGNGGVSVNITDEEGRVNINALNEQELLDWLLALKLKRVKKGDILDLEFAEQDIHMELTNALLDWRDFDDVERPGGAENRYYKREEEKRIAHNQPLATPGELLLVKGFTGDMLFGRKGNPRLYDMISVVGPGKHNINTIAPEVLESLIAMDQPYQAEFITKSILEFRPYQSLGDFQSLAGRYGLSNTTIQKFQIESTFFRIRATGRVGKQEAIVEAIVKRNAKKCDIVWWKESLDSQAQ